MTLNEKINHISTRIDEFKSLTGRDSVLDYFLEYGNKYEDPNELYYRLCDDLEIEPLGN